MATCPRCGGFLSEGHRCVGLWRVHVRVWRDRLLGGVIGGLAGWLVLIAVQGQASWIPVVVASLIGIVIVTAIQRG